MTQKLKKVNLLGYHIDGRVDEVSTIEQEVILTKEYENKQKEKKVVQKSIKTAKEKLRAVNLQPKKQTIIRLADKR